MSEPLFSRIDLSFFSLKLWRILSGSLVWCVLVPVWGMPMSLAQVMGELAEMDRLEQRADDAIANGDPEGAALSIGKAALMAGLLAKKEAGQNARLLYQAVETLFRGHEQGYRAIALFERAGAQPPASKGVCQFLVHAAEMVKKSRNELEALPDFSNESVENRRQRHIDRSKEWEDRLQGLQQDFSC